ncbi:hypothetical protein AVEN_213918-1 [Araneus ventricosus]|uniref:Uncharacterized protein n=1 Tax=Araneus ventricosus TaxID=182803 RepID=A0A4Y2U911_ARAVE|nr:hypothetical protein AVEN_232549-1 [Araneus ventricosus]GBO08087.1 hypothetical protein AVEN_213918-1 [Araneus ventricosus]
MMLNLQVIWLHDFDESEIIQCRRVHFASIVPLYSDNSHLTTYAQSVARHLEFSNLPCAGTKGMSSLLLENSPLLFGSPLSSAP